MRTDWLSTQRMQLTGWCTSGGCTSGRCARCWSYKRARARIAAPRSTFSRLSTVSICCRCNSQRSAIRRRPRTCSGTTTRRTWRRPIPPIPRRLRVRRKVPTTPKWGCYRRVWDNLTHQCDNTLTRQCDTTLTRECINSLTRQCDTTLTRECDTTLMCEFRTSKYHSVRSV